MLWGLTCTEPQRPQMVHGDGAAINFLVTLEKTSGSSGVGLGREVLGFGFGTLM